MSLEEFEKAVQLAVLEGWKDNGTVYVEHVRKNNNLVLSALHIYEENDKTVPIVYLQDYYEEYCRGRSFENIIQDIRLFYEEAYGNVPCNMLDYTDFNEVKQHVIYRIVSYPKNREILKDCPHIVMHDLAVTFRCFIFQDEEAIASSLIKNDHLKIWGVTDSELLFYANENTPKFFPPFVMKLEEFLENIGLLDCIDSRDPLDIYIVSNSQKVNGASVILYEDILKDFGDWCKSDYFILPSSIHEVLFLPIVFPKNLELYGDKSLKREYVHNMASETLTGMVKEINMTVVGEEEFLSDSVYYYCREDNKLELA